jgi:PKD repeat protein
MAVTHGRGIFTSDAWSKASPIANFGISKDTVCSNQTVVFKDSTRNVPTSWKWSFSPSAGVVYKFGTDSTKQNPIVQFTKGGTYSVTLSVSNAVGDDVMVKTNKIFVIDTIPLIVTLATNPAILCRNDTFSLRSTVNAEAKGLVLSYSWMKNSVVTSATMPNIYGISPNNGDAFKVTVSTKSACVIPNPAMSSVVTIKTYGVKTITVSCNLDTLKAANVGTGLYTWYKDGISVGTGRLFKATKVGNYRCVYTENGCNSDSSAILMLKSVGTGKIDMKQFLVIYPNPAKDVLNVSVTEPGKLKLMDVGGRLIREWNISSKGLHTLSLEGIPAGNAIVRFETISELKYNTLSIVIQ